MEADKHAGTFHDPMDIAWVCCLQLPATRAEMGRTAQLLQHTRAHTGFTEAGTLVSLHKGLQTTKFSTMRSYIYIYTDTDWKLIPNPPKPTLTYF